MDRQDGHHDVGVSEPFALPPLLDVAAAPELLESLRRYVAVAEAVVLDGQMIERVSTPCLQILLATALDAHSRGVACRLREPSPVLANALAELGLASRFDR